MTGAAVAGTPVVQCSTGSLAPFGGGRYFNSGAVLEGVKRLGWPAVELRLWLEWGESALAGVAARVADLGVAVGSVHAPPDTETLFSAPGHEAGATDLVARCADAAHACGAGVVVAHAWDIRRPEFNRAVLVNSVCRAAKQLKDLGLVLSVENIPGHGRLLPLLVDACHEVEFTVDTQWTALEGTWDLVFALADRVSNVHVQTFVDLVAEGAATSGASRVKSTAGGMASADTPAVRLGRTATGCDFDAEWAVGMFLKRGYSRLITLEPHGVPAVDERAIRSALTLLQDWTRCRG